MRDDIKIVHETQPVRQREAIDDPYMDPMLKDCQTIEFGGPIRKIDFKAMPGFVRYFGYFFMAAMVLGLILLIWAIIFK